MHCTGLVRFTVFHISVKTLKMILCILRWKIVKTDTYFHLNFSIIYFTLFFEFTCNTLILLTHKSFISIVFITTKHAHFPYAKLRIWSSCCAGLRQRCSWFLRIMRAMGLTFETLQGIFWIAKRWITFRVPANWIRFWYSIILSGVYKW